MQHFNPALEMIDPGEARCNRDMPAIHRSTMKNRVELHVHLSRLSRVLAHVLPEDVVLLQDG